MTTMRASTIALCLSSTAAARAPTRTTFTFAVGSRRPLSIGVQEVTDRAWWAEQSEVEGSNPFGAKLWPAALGVANHLADLPGDRLRGLQVVDCGCGNGLCSLTLAAMGANVTATDISPVALSLTARAAAAQSLDVATLCFDVGSTEPLPKADLYIFADLLYDAQLARFVANRVSEAARRGAWGIVGSHTISGREAFLSRLDALLDPTPAFGEEQVVRSKALKWKEKRWRRMELNVPAWAQTTDMTTEPRSKSA